MHKARKLIALAGVCAFAVALAASPAVAATSAAKQHSKQAQSAKKKKKAKTKRGKTGKTGKTGQRGPAGPAGTPGAAGPQGAAGSAVAYAVVKNNVAASPPTLVAGQSKNIDSVRQVEPGLTLGSYCVTAAAGILRAQHPALATSVAFDITDLSDNTVFWEAAADDPRCNGPRDYVISTLDNTGNPSPNRSFAVAIF